MAMNKQRKMLIGVLLLGVGGLGVDRFVIGTPDAAAADDTATVEAVVPGIEPIVIDEPTTQVGEEQAKALPSYASLTERLVQAQEQQALSHDGNEREDPFALPEQWQSDKIKPRISTGDTPASAQGVQINSLFKLDGTVRSLIDGKEELLAVISGGGLDGRAIRVGQKIRIPNDRGASEEYVLVEVGSRYVIWKSLSSGQRIEMKVEEVL